MCCDVPCCVTRCEQEFKPRNKKSYSVTYDDGDSELLNLAEEKWQLLEQPKQADKAPTAAAAGSSKAAAAAAGTKPASKKQAAADKPAAAEPAAKKAAGKATKGKAAAAASDKAEEEEEEQRPAKQPKKQPAAAKEKQPAAAKKVAAPAGPGHELVGKQVKVWWPGEKAWFTGKVAVSVQFISTVTSTLRSTPLPAAGHRLLRPTCVACRHTAPAASVARPRGC